MISAFARHCESWLARTSACTVRPSLHAAWRVMFGVLAVIMAWRALPLVSFPWWRRPVVMPETYVGNARVDLVPWIEMLRYDPAAESFAYMARPMRYPSRPIVRGFDRPARIEIRPGPAPPALGDLPSR